MKNTKSEFTTFEIIATILFFAIVPLIIAINQIPEPVQRRLTNAWLDIKLVTMTIFFLVTMPFVYIYDRLTGQESWVPKVNRP